MKKQYTGSCHCGAVRFEASIDLSAGTNKCNCSICVKARNWSAIIKPSDFHLISGEDDLSEYRFGTMSMQHLFCKHCGIRSFGRGYLKEIGGDYIAVQLAALDNVTPAELLQAPVHYANGRNNDWMTTPDETRHL